MELSKFQHKILKNWGENINSTFTIIKLNHEIADLLTSNKYQQGGKKDTWENDGVKGVCLTDNYQ